MYAVRLGESGTLDDKGIITGGQVDDNLDIEIGNEREVQYLCAKNEDDTYTTLKVTEENVSGEGLDFRIDNENEYFYFKINQEKEVGGTGEIVVTLGDGI